MKNQTFVLALAGASLAVIVAGTAYLHAGIENNAVRLAEGSGDAAALADFHFSGFSREVSFNDFFTLQDGTIINDMSLQERNLKSSFEGVSCRWIINAAARDTVEATAQTESRRYRSSVFSKATTYDYTSTCNEFTEVAEISVSQDESYLLPLQTVRLEKPVSVRANCGIADDGSLDYVNDYFFYNNYTWDEVLPSITQHGASLNAVNLDGTPYAAWISADADTAPAALTGAKIYRIEKDTDAVPIAVQGNEVTYWTNAKATPIYTLQKQGSELLRLAKAGGSLCIVYLCEGDICMDVIDEAGKLTDTAILSGGNRATLSSGGQTRIYDGVQLDADQLAIIEREGDKAVRLYAVRISGGHIVATAAVTENEIEKVAATQLSKDGKRLLLIKDNAVSFLYDNQQQQANIGYVLTVLPVEDGVCKQAPLYDAALPVRACDWRRDVCGTEYNRAVLLAQSGTGLRTDMLLSYNQQLQNRAVYSISFSWEG